MALTISILTSCALSFLSVTLVRALSDFNITAPFPPPDECDSYTFTWTGGTPPFILRIVQSGSLATLEQFSGLTGNSFDWASNLPAFTQVFVNMQDQAGQSVNSDAFVIQPGAVDD